MAPGSKEARQGLRIANDHKPGEEGGDGGGLEESVRSENLLEEPTQGGQKPLVGSPRALVEIENGKGETKLNLFPFLGFHFYERETKKKPPKSVT